MAISNNQNKKLSNEQKGTVRKKTSKETILRMISTPVFWGVFLIVFLALFGEIIVPHDPEQPNMAMRLEPPSAEYWFGTDHMGMDVFSRVIAATRTALSIAMLGVVLGMSVGVPLGVVSAYYGGIMDDISSRFVEVIQSFPMFLFAIALFIMIGVGYLNLLLIIAIYNIPVFLKLVRSVVLPMRNCEYVLAARCAGNSQASVLFRHILPNALGPVLSQFSIQGAYAIQIIAGLSFIGVGIEPPQPEWGQMIMRGAPHIVRGYWWASVFPGLAIFLSVILMHNLGHRLMSLYRREV